MNLTTTPNKKNAVELRKELRADGTEIEYICVDGVKCGVVGYTSDKDKEDAMNALNKALESAGGNLMEAIAKLTDVAQINDLDVPADEMVNVDGVDYLVDYENRKLRDMSGNIVANCDDLANVGMANEAIKALLLARIPHGNDDYDDDDDDDDMNTVVYI